MTILAQAFMFLIASIIFCISIIIIAVTLYALKEMYKESKKGGK